MAFGGRSECDSEQGYRGVKRLLARVIAFVAWLMIKPAVGIAFVVERLNRLAARLLEIE